MNKAHTHTHTPFNSVVPLMPNIYADLRNNWNNFQIIVNYLFYNNDCCSLPKLRVLAGIVMNDNRTSNTSHNMSEKYTVLKK